MLIYANILIKKSILSQPGRAHLGTQVTYAFHTCTVLNKCSLVTGCIMHLCFVGAGYAVARHKAVCCGVAGR